MGRKNSKRGLSGWVILALVLGASGLGFGVYMFINPPASINGTPKGIEARAYSSSNYFINELTLHTINFTTKNFDSDNAFNLTSNLYIAPESGYYLIVGKVSMNLNDAEVLRIFIDIDGVYETLTSTTTRTSGGLATITAEITDILNITAGQSITLGLWHFNGLTNSRQVNGGSIYTFLAISRINS